MARKPKLRLVAGAKAGKPTYRRGVKWVPTPLERRTVERCIAMGLNLEQTAHVIGKSHDALQKHCRKEIDGGFAKVAAKVGGQFLKKALAGDTAAMIFFMKCRMGWSEKQTLEHTGRGGGPIQYDATAADADAFTKRILHLAERYGTPPPTTIEALALPPPEPSQLN
jgi:hypothetical protein